MIGYTFVYAVEFIIAILRAGIAGLAWVMVRLLFAIVGMLMPGLTDNAITQIGSFWDAVMQPFQTVGNGPIAAIGSYLTIDP